MANELANRNATFSEVLTSELVANSEALPKGFSIPRYVKNCIALLNGNDALKEFNKKYGNEQIKIGLLTAAYSGLDASQGQCFLIPYGSQINFVASWKGMTVLATRKSIKPIDHFTVSIVREGEVFQYGSDNGNDYYKHQINCIAEDKRIIGAYACCQYTDGQRQLEVMSLSELEAARSQSKARNSMAWAKFPEEMYKKVVLRRLCKRIPMDDLDPTDMDVFNNGVDIETDTKELAKRDIAAGENSVDFVEAEVRTVM